MDEGTFHSLLTGNLSRLLDPRTLEKGAEYVRRGHVLGTHYEPDGEGGTLVGMVKGGAIDPYVAAVHLLRDRARVRLDSHCTCPLQSGCKHVAATALALLRGVPAGAADEHPVPSGQLGPWKNWLDALLAPAQNGPVLAAERAASVCGILLRAGEGALPRLQAQAVRLQRGKRGGFVSPQPLQPSYGEPAPWSGLSPNEFRLVADLRMRRPSPEAGGGGWFDLRRVADETLLEELLGALPCFFEKTAGGRLQPGPQRALRIGWVAREDGTQKLALSVDATSAKTRLLRVGGLWYCDPVAHRIGRVDGEVRLAEAVLRAPPLLPEQVPLLLERWKDAPLLAALRTGEMWYRKGSVKVYAFIDGGFAEVLPDRVSILAQVAERAEDIDIQRAEASKRRAEERLSRPTTTDFDAERARIALLRAITRLNVSRQGRSRT